MIFLEVRFFITGPEHPRTLSSLCTSFSASQLSDELKMSEDLFHESMCDLAPPLSSSFQPSQEYPIPKFPRFLWFVVDGWSRNYANQTFIELSQPGASFLLNVPSLKYSHVIYSSLLTGTMVSNYAGLPLSSDNFLHSYKRGGGKVMYLGPEWSFLAIHGTHQYDVIFDTIELFTEAHTIDFTHNFPTIFLPANLTNPSVQDYERKPPELGSRRDRAITENVEYFLDQVKARGESLVAHSGVFDHVAHSRDVPKTEATAKTVSRDMLRMKEWLDRNPEYLLVISSDHGVDEGKYAEILHGYSENGNSGIFLLYNKYLNASTLQREPIECRGRYESCGERWIETVDMAAFLSPLLVNVDIPYSAVGVGQPLPENPKYKSKFYTQNLIQVLRAAKARNLLTKSFRDKSVLLLERFSSFNSNTSNSELETFNTDIRSFLFKLGNHLMEMTGFPFVPLILSIVFVGLLIAVILTFDRFSLWQSFAFFALNIYFLASLLLGYDTPEPTTVSSGLLITASLCLLVSSSINSEIIGLMIANHIIGLILPFAIDAFSNELETFSLSGFGRFSMYTVFVTLIVVYKLKSNKPKANEVTYAQCAIIIVSALLSLFAENTPPVWLDNFFNLKYIPIYILFGILLTISIPLFASHPRHVGLWFCYFVFFTAAIVPVLRYAVILMTIKTIILFAIFDHVCNQKDEQGQTKTSLFTLTTLCYFILYQILSDITILQSDLISLSVKPQFGRAGIQSDNVYPGFSATCMAFSKFYSIICITFGVFDALRQTETKSQNRTVPQSITEISKQILDCIYERFPLLVFAGISSLLRLSYRISLWQYTREKCFELLFSLMVISLGMSAVLAFCYTCWDGFQILQIRAKMTSTMTSTETN
ncbi:hypothetical protein RCL1_005126 [Eukaryota sp. TZLM3-RCL]